MSRRNALNIKWPLIFNIKRRIKHRMNCVMKFQYCINGIHSSLRRSWRKMTWSCFICVYRIYRPFIGTYSVSFDTKWLFIAFTLMRQNKMKTQKFQKFLK